MGICKLRLQKMFEITPNYLWSYLVFEMDGGAILGANVIVENSRFFDCVATLGSGGAIYASVSVKIRDSVFNQTNANELGSAIYTSGTVEMTGVRFLEMNVDALSLVTARKGLTMVQSSAQNVVGDVYGKTYCT